MVGQSLGAEMTYWVLNIMAGLGKQSMSLCTNRVYRGSVCKVFATQEQGPNLICRNLVKKPHVQGMHAEYPSFGRDRVSLWAHWPANLISKFQIPVRDPLSKHNIE